MTLKGCWRKRNGLITMRCFNGRCPPPAGKVRPGAAGEEGASGWHWGSHLRGNTASLIPEKQSFFCTALHLVSIQIIPGKAQISSKKTSKISQVKAVKSVCKFIISPVTYLIYHFTLLHQLYGERSKTGRFVVVDYKPAGNQVFPYWVLLVPALRMQWMKSLP